jgi:hypothetical protein
MARLPRATIVDSSLNLDSRLAKHVPNRSFCQHVPRIHNTRTRSTGRHVENNMPLSGRSRNQAQFRLRN